MTKIQMQQKIALLTPWLTAPVDVDEELNEDGIPVTTLSYGNTQISIHVNHTEIQLRDVVMNLPIATGDKLAAVAVMLLPVGTGV